jgi:endonuclease/exonuclease/phosphatase family metal-dependent hydrolase
MRIVSLNAWGGAMFDDLAAWLPEVGADVLCLQEVTRTPNLGSWTTFVDGERELPQRANLFDDVRRLLPQHQASFVASDAGPVRDSTGAQYRQDFGLAIFVRECLPVIGQLSRFVHRRFVDHEDWTTSDRPRIAQGVRLWDRRVTRPVTLVHTHGLRDAAGKHDTPARQQQAQRIASLVEDLREPSDLTVVCGDLNLLPTSTTFGVLAEIGLTDLVGMTDTRTTRYTKPLRSANYLLVSDRGRVRHFQAPPSPEVSDHRPLILDI